jgi:iron complex outermembrane receptor protein
VNYTLKGENRFSATKIRLTFNNLFDEHSVTGIKAAKKTSNIPAGGDLLTKLAARSVALSVTFGLSPNSK